LGDVVFVELPTEGTEVVQGGESSFFSALSFYSALDLGRGEGDMVYKRGS